VAATARRLLRVQSRLAVAAVARRLLRKQSRLTVAATARRLLRVQSRPAVAAVARRLLRKQSRLAVAATARRLLRVQSRLAVAAVVCRLLRKQSRLTVAVAACAVPAGRGGGGSGRSTLPSSSHVLVAVSIPSNCRSRIRVEAVVVWDPGLLAPPLTRAGSDADAEHLASASQRVPQSRRMLRSQLDPARLAPV